MGYRDNLDKWLLEFDEVWFAKAVCARPKLLSLLSEQWISIPPDSDIISYLESRGRIGQAWINVALREIVALSVFSRAPTFWQSKR